MRKQIVSILVFFILVFSNIIYAQINYKFENFGNRSILLNGNVTGSVDDLGATYYNPARLALIEDPVFSINARIYQLTNLKLENITLDGSDLTRSDFDGLPSMVAGTFKLKFLEGHQFAYAFFSRNRSNLSLNYNTELTTIEENGGNSNFEKYIGNTSINNKLKENWFGLSWAKSLSSNFSIGASMFFSIYKFNGDSTQQYSSINENEQVIFYNNAISFQQKSDGFFTKIAVAWILPKIELGFNIDLPYIEFNSEGKYKYEEYLSGLGPENDIFTFNDFDNLNAKRKYPLGVSIGAGIPLNKNKIHINLSWNSKTNEYSKIDIPPLESETENDLPIITFNEELNSTINYGIGAEIYISPNVDAFGSFSSDYSPFETSATILSAIDNSGENINFETDYFHYGFGINVSHKWANFILGSVYSRGNSKIIKPLTFPEDITEITNETSDIHINRWRFLIGIEVLFLDKTLNKHGIDKKIIIQ